jgi:hypothetical protein
VRALPKLPDHLRPVETDSATAPEAPAKGPPNGSIEQWTDLYFLKTKAVVA